MTRNTPSHSLLIASGLGLALATGCASHAPTAVPASYLEGTVLDRHEIGVEKRTEFLEIDIAEAGSQLSQADRRRIERFVYTYRDKGHGPLILSMPGSTANPQLAVAAVAEAREIAYATGVNYEEIAGNTHGAGGRVSEPLIMAFQTYEAIAPDCKSLASFDFSDEVKTNNEMSSLGCSVRANQAAMIADPADLLGQRPLGASDPVRRDTILAKFRGGESTGSERSQSESGVVSEAVQE